VGRENVERGHVDGDDEDEWMGRACASRLRGGGVCGEGGITRGHVTLYNQKKQLKFNQPTKKNITSEVVSPS
jgi:hypothetical protein